MKMAAENTSPNQEVQSQAWMESIKEKLTLNERSLKLSIFKVPNKLHKVSQDFYSPCIVSIGPFHSSKDDHYINGVATSSANIGTSLLQQTLVKKHDQLQAMEEHKWWYAQSLIHRTRNRDGKPKAKEFLEKCGKVILGKDSIVRGSYAAEIKFQLHELAEIMLIDGFFILELFIRSWSPLQENEDGDHIFNNAWMVPALQQDLALLENQIPFFILQELYDIVMPNNDSQMPSVAQLALTFFHPDLKSNEEAIRNKCKMQDGDEPWKHLLDLLHKFYLPTPSEKELEGNKDLKLNPEAIREICSTSLEKDPEGQEDLESNQEIIENRSTSHEVIDPKGQEIKGFGKCATKLSEAGIEFKTATTDHLLAVGFREGYIIIPQLCIDEKTESLIRNLNAFEQWSPGSKHYVSSYLFLLKSLIDSSQDVELLKQRDIITPNLVEVENVLNFFNNISREIKLKDSCFGELRTKVNNYQNSWHWHRIKVSYKVRGLRYLKDLKRDYFSSPWSIISLIAAVVLLFLTAVQTYYTVRSYSYSQFLTTNLFPQFDQKIQLKEEHHRLFLF